MSCSLVPRSEQHHGPASADYILKCIFVGEPYSGKSSLLGAIDGEDFDATREPTIGIDFRSATAIGSPKQGSTDPVRYRLQMWDCAGQVRFRSIVKSYYRLTHVVFVVFDLTDRSSFDAVADWVEDIRKNIDTPHALVLIGNKCDQLKHSAHAVSDRQLWELVEDLRFDAYTPTSALTGENLTDAINTGISKAHQLVLSGRLRLDPCVQKFELTNDDHNQCTSC